MHQIYQLILDFSIAISESSAFPISKMPHYQLTYHT